MSESATAEKAYFDGLTARHNGSSPLPKEVLATTMQRVSTLPAELRLKILEFAFAGNRVAVTADADCYCASAARGPYRAEHQWLLVTAAPRTLQREATRIFVRVAIWELHCHHAQEGFTRRMRALGYTRDVRHVRLSAEAELYLSDPPDEEDAAAAWRPRQRQRPIDLSAFPNLHTATFAPWQKAWTVVIPHVAGSPALADKHVTFKLWEILVRKEAYESLRIAYGARTVRRWRMLFVFPVQFYLPQKEWTITSQGLEPKWQLCVWRADLDRQTIERDWKEVHLDEEATLDSYGLE